jgi:hypothetical protein
METEGVKTTDDFFEMPLAEECICYLDRGANNFGHDWTNKKASINDGEGEIKEKGRVDGFNIYDDLIQVQQRHNKSY